MRDYGLYVITDETISGGRSHAHVAEQAVLGGADVIQLRDKHMGGREMLHTALAIREITYRAGVTFIVNDRLDIALLSAADGVHLGQGDIDASSARSICPPGFIIGVSVGDAEEAVQAEEAGADYLGPGPIFFTGSNADAAPACGLEVLKAMRAKVSIPLVAIGGINRGNLASVLENGADGVAVISAAVAPPDIARACIELKALIQDVRLSRV
ncbi:MAG: thiamine phosphate synthase [Candidatus Methanomethylophilaceae archaeon]